MKIHPKRNGKKRKELTSTAKKVTLAYMRDEEGAAKPEVSVNWVSYRFSSEYHTIEEEGKKVLLRAPSHYYDVGDLNINGRIALILKTPNNRRQADLEGIAYNSVD